MTDNKSKYHRTGKPGGAACPVGVLSFEFGDSEGRKKQGFLLDPGKEASEVELLRTVASRLGVRWGQDEFGWWAALQMEEFPSWAVWRQDDNGNKFLVQANLRESEAIELVKHYEELGHKQVYWAVDEKNA